MQPEVHPSEISRTHCANARLKWRDTISAYQILALILGPVAAVGAIELERLLLPPAGNPRIYTYYGLPNVAIWLAFCFLLGLAMNMLGLAGKIRNASVLEYVIVLYLYGKFRRTR